ncbi:MAG: phosphatase PAP2 family protein [Prevotella sp.]|jgi:undecaprenyl-diphosphatase|nr:phosphatase PAP2 family protein [Prevotella sp.]
MLNKIIDWDKEIFLFLNGKHADWLDPIMLFLSSSLCWVLVFILMTALIYWRSEVWKKTATLFFMLSVGASALFTNLIKLVIERPRPIHNALWKDTIHAIEEYSASYSFFSSHSATTFSMAVFFFLVFRKHKLYGVIAILWATLVAYSRIYVAKHYPSDVMVGIIFGIIMGILGFKLFEYYTKRKDGLVL